MKEITLPTEGLVFWPVGNGDCTTISVSSEVVMQVDIRSVEDTEEADEDYKPVVDRLVGILPRKDGEPYLAAFVLTHPDQDHCLGFKDLLSKVTIGELWHSPRIFREYGKDLCDDAKAFRKEARRRVKKTIELGGNVESGDRVRIIGYDDLLKEDDYAGFPEDCLTIPGSDVSVIDGSDWSGKFRAFIHAPFKDDSAGERNLASVAMQITLREGEAIGKYLMCGDLAYPTMRRIFDTSDKDDVAWNVFLAPHHCSKSVMYWDNEQGEEELKQDLLDDLEAAAESSAVVVVSSVTIPKNNKPGDNPPHAKAKARYEEIASEFMCTADASPTPIAFSLSEDGGFVISGEADDDGDEGLAAAVSQARGTGKPPKDRVGFGRAL